MENFFNWMAKPLPKDEIIIWLNIHNMTYEKIELYGDFFKSLNQIIIDTYLGDNTSETKILLSLNDNLSHFEWCWNKTIENFKKENVRFNTKGDHFEYFNSFFMEVYYTQKNNNVRDSIDSFLKDLFNRKIPFTKSDLELYTELYKLLDKNISQ